MATTKAWLVTNWRPREKLATMGSKNEARLKTTDGSEGAAGKVGGLYTIAVNHSNLQYPCRFGVGAA